MKKVLPLLVFLGLIVLGIIYYTGMEVEKQFSLVNQSLYEVVNLKPIDSSYQRGWFRSYAKTVVETPDYNDSRLVLVHDIEHGFLQIQPTLIHSTLHPSPVVGTELSEILLEVYTTVQINGDSVSKLKMPALHVKDDKASLQWQGLQGTVYAKGNFAAIQTEIHSPQIELDTAQGKIVIQQISLTADVQPGSATGEGSLTIADILVAGKQKPPVTFTGVKLVGNNNIVNDNLMVEMKTVFQKIQVGADDYGSGSANFELLNWHLPTLTSIKNTLVNMGNQGLLSRLQTNVAMFRLIPYGMALSKNAPEFAVNHLNFNTSEGELGGTLQVKFSPFDENIIALIINPSLLLNAVSGQLSMYIPQSLLQDSIEPPVINQTIRQALKTWLDKGILMPAEDKPDYYRSKMELKEGVLQVNGQPLPIAEIWSYR